MGILISGLYLFFAPWLALSNVFMLAIIIGFAFTLKPNYWSRSAWSMPAVILLMLYTVVLLGLIYTPASWYWASLNWGKYTKMIYAVILMLLLWRQPVWQQRALKCFVLSMLFILASTWLNIWFELPWSASKVTGWGVSHHVLNDYIIQNVMMAFFSVFALSSVNWRSMDRVSWFWLIVAVLSIISISHLSAGRTGLVVLLAGVLAWIFFLLGWRKMLVGLPTLMLGAVLLIGSSTLIRDRFALAVNEFSQRDVDPLSSIGHRAYNYKITPQLIAEKPIFGHGTGAYHTEICRFVEKPEWCEIFNWHSHNQFLFFGADYGLVGMLLYAALIASLFFIAIRSEKTKPRIWLGVLATILLVDSMINSPLFSSYESHFFLYMMALIVAINRESVLTQ